jgi:hypothetical protein
MGRRVPVPRYALMLAFALSCQGAPRAEEQPPSREPMTAPAPATVAKTRPCAPSPALPEGALPDIECGEHCVAYVPARAHAAGLQIGLPLPGNELRLRSLITDQEEIFEGELVPHAQLPPHLAALRMGTSLGLLDARSRTWLARVTTKRPASSVATSADSGALYVLSVDPERDPDDERNYDAWLEVFRVPPASGPPASHRHRYSVGELRHVTKFDGSMDPTREPHVYRIDSGELVVGHVVGCNECAHRAPEAHVFRVVDRGTGQPTGEAGFRYLRDLSPGGLEQQLWKVEPRGAVPERVKRAIEASRCR